RKIKGVIDNKPVFTREMSVGDRVIHNATQRRGKVTGVQYSGGVQQISVELDTGVVMHMLDRREFSLCSK
ncbi:MAG: hypothetical protein ACREDR_46465, partial [Blastocatellia bacterium]